MNERGQVSAPPLALEAIERQCALRPQDEAVRQGAETLSYAELNARANRLARWLQQRGAGRGVIVALLAQRSVHWLTGWLAVLKTGACYLPIDPQYPSARVANMLADSGAKLLLTDAATAARLPGIDGTAFVLDRDLSDLAALASDNLPLISEPNDALYLIYTSGSTGTPKGALVSQAGAANLYFDYIDQLRLSDASRFLIVSSMGFDLTQKNLFCPLMVGGSVVFPQSPVFDPQSLLDEIAAQGITNLNATPSAFHALIADADTSTWSRLAGLKQVALGGESVDLARLADWRAHCPQAELINGYGPTECSAVVSLAILPAGAPAPERFNIGHAIANVGLHVLDEQLQPVRPGEEGELCVSGYAVGLGYLNRPELTAERFIDHWQFGRLYRTGDRVRQLADSSFDFLGRADGQVKLRGFRIELGEIEAALREQPSVRDAAVAVKTREGGEPRLIAYLVPRDGTAPQAEALRAALATRLPDYMLPAAYLTLPALPLNVHGKLDRNALPDADADRPAIAAAYVAPREAFERAIATQWAQALGLQSVGIDDPFFDLGGSSLLAVQIVNQLARQLGTRLSVADFFGAATPRRWAAELREQYGAIVAAQFGTITAASAPDAAPRLSPHASPLTKIAIVGLAARMPGADDVDQFWQNLIDGTESIVPVSEADLDEAGIPASLRSDPNYVRMSATLAHAECFDAAFFGITPREAALMDPQQRVLLECAWTALEHAGYDPQAVRSDAGALRTGVFAGVARNSYFSHNLANDPATRAQLGDVHITFGNDKDYAATRVAHKLGLKGPAISVQTACSTGGVLMHLARRSLQAGECDMALVGGARVVSPLRAGYPWIDGSIFSRDGRMRVFDAQGSGMVRGSGVACVVLKRLDDAQRDGDTVYAVLAGSALNNDGADKAGYTAPSVPGQAEVIGMALDDAGLSAEAISYIDAHGTATALGDPIEVAALTRAYRKHTDKTAFCRIGSVKSNVGHLDPAAALASTIKVALALRHRRIPATLGFEQPNPQIDFEHSPFVVAAQASDWQGEAPLRAGVSSFGIGGTNAHLILEEAPASPASLAPTRAWQWLPLSAKTEAALQEGAAHLGGWLQTHADTGAATPQQSQFLGDASAYESATQTGDATLADAAWTLQTGRTRFAQRTAIIARDSAAAASALAAPERWLRGTPLADPALVFVFPGQGSQHPGMGRALYDSEPVYRRVIDEGSELLKPLLGEDLRALMLAPAGDAQAATALRQTSLAQPAIYLVSYALAQLALSVGLKPTRLIGHSVGEFVAATLAGVFTFADALAILAARARLMQSMPTGAMLAVRLPEAELRPLLPADLDIAAVNAPGATIIAGPSERIAAFDAELQARSVGTAALHTSHAFHSQMMEPALAPFAAEVAQHPRRAPQLEIISSVTGVRLTDEQAQSPDYWAQQLRSTVRFGDAVNTVLGETGAQVFLEVGPGQSLAGPLRQLIAAQSANARAAAVSVSPPAAAERASAAEQFQTAIAQAWIAGVEPDWKLLHGGTRQRIGLPGYAFARTRHWITPQLSNAAAPLPEAVDETAAASSAPAAPAADPLRERVVKLLAAITGMEFSDADEDRSFLELGMDSLVLTQAASKLKNEFRVDLRFRQLMEELSTLRTLVAHLTQHAAPNASPAPDGNRAPDNSSAPEASREAVDTKKAFGAAVRINKSLGETLSARQRRALEALSTRYLKRTPGSKASAQEHRRYFADPRTVSGFRPLWKELVYPIVSTHSQGAKLWDVDGNEYIDTVNGFGATIFGHKPAFVDAALHAQIDKGYEVGPVQDFVGETARRFCEMTGNERVAFCNTGSEAVSAAVRCARTVTGRDLVVSFNHDYHGIQDEAIVRPGRDGRGVPAAGGIPFSNTASTLVLEYGDPKSLEIIKARAHEIAAVMVEPVQSRNMDLQPREFLHAARALADEGGYALIFDEVITGFRCAPGGAQEHFGVRADIATYGKVFGGGLPVGAVSGKALYLDALDGGHWQFGDGSVPEAGVTYFAGTFVRHPLVMAGVLATLRHLQENPSLQATLNTRIAAFVARLHALTAELQAPLRFPHFASAFRLEWTQDEPFSELLAVYLRERGLHTYDGRVQMMTTAHDDAVLDRIYDIFADSLRNMQRDGLLGRVGEPVKIGLDPLAAGGVFYRAPRADAQLGRDARGLPAWFVPDPARPGRYLQLDFKAQD